MSHFGDFMDGVPVKISEKYIRPLRFNLPYTVNECAARAQDVVDGANYSCTFEKNVLAKIRELKNVKETKKNERRHRLQLLQEAEQKKLDAIAAAEDEERLKQLSVSEVSYPSTDEISALSPDEKADKNCDINPSVENVSENADKTNNIAHASTSVAESQSNILQPILVKTYPENSLLDDPLEDPLQNLKLNVKINKMPQNRNIETLTYRDFENDNSSPFDNVELKTINDMEMLAQVLQPHKETSVTHNSEITYVQDQANVIPNSASQAQVEGVTYLPAGYLEHPVQGSGLMYSSPQHYPMPNGYYIPAENEVNMYMPNYQYYVPPNTYSVDPYYSQIPTTSGQHDMSQIVDGSYIPQPYYYPYSQIPVPYQPSTLPYQAVVHNEVIDSSTTPNIVTENPTKSRSRSVPDIVRELNEELTKLKMSERSHVVSPAPKSQTETQSTKEKKNVEKKERHKKKTEHLPNPFEKLSPKLQEMCRKIHGMGFPLDRVARVCTLLGENDKKVIEGLLILNELMDLGFSESKVSAALAKHEFNRDKALDELVS